MSNSRNPGPLTRWVAQWSVRTRASVVATLLAAGMLAGGLVVVNIALMALGTDQVALDMVLVTALAAGLGLVAWITWHAAGQALAPVQTMSAELKTVTDHRERRRVTQPASRDEIAELARSVNLMLQRLETLAERQRAWAADASHELRSPLTGMRTQLETALQHPDQEEWPQVAASALADTDRLQHIVQDLLTLAKLEEEIHSERETINLGRLVEAEITHRTARDQTPIMVQTDQDIWVVGAPLHLIRLLTNLLDNAERHARSLVRVTVGRNGSDAVLTVADDGPGIPPRQRQQVFQRFQQLPPGHHHDNGTGLGLPICRDIAAAHGGTLTIADQPGGAQLILHLPLYAHQHPANQQHHS